MKAKARFQGFARLQSSATTVDSLILSNRFGRVEVGSVAPGVLRLRVTSTKEDPSAAPQGSWAVLAQPRDGSPATTRINRGHAILQTTEAVFEFSLPDGGWHLSAAGLELFRGLPGTMGFEGTQPRLTLALHEREGLFGLGESSGSFNKRGQIRDFWNIDVLGHSPTIHPSLRNLYVSVPFALSLRDGRAAGLFWDNPARQSWDMGQSKPDHWTLQADSGDIDLYLCTGPTVADVARQYTQLTGRAPMPPKWGLGYHQCRYSYESAIELRQIATGFRKRQIPCDALYLDIHHMDAYRVFTFGCSFPKPATLLRQLAKDGFQVVAIVDPGVQDNPDFPVCNRGIAADAFVKQPDGKTDVIGEVWPGKSRFPDFLKASTREWWGREQAALQRVGIAGFWNDMNEPANFARPDKTLPSDSVHHTDLGTALHATVHNLYGMQMARASRDGALTANPEARPFVITRSTYAGGQRHAVVWTGDNSSNWEHLRDSIQMLLNLGLSGFPVCGADAGGFLDNATPELFIRWLQLAAFTPFFRGHSNVGTLPHEPWAFGPRTEGIARQVIQQRYQLLQLFYSLAAEAHTTGAPIMRPLLWHYPNDPTAVARGDQFLVGRDLLVAPILEQGSEARAVYLPNDAWYDLWTDARLTGGQHHLASSGLDHIPVFVRGGAILPFIEEAQCSGMQDLSTVTLNVWPGVNEGFDWYEDDGTTQSYETGNWHRRRMRLQRQSRRLGLEIGAATGKYPSQVRTWRVILHDVHRAARVTLNGSPVDVMRFPEVRLLAVEVAAGDAPARIEFGPA